MTSALRTVVALVSLASTASAIEVVEQPRHLEYRIAWNGIPAANATVAIASEDLAGERAYTVRTTARTNRIVDIFWRYRGEARATFLANGLIPLQFTYRRTTKGVTSMTWIDFDLVDRRAQSVYMKDGRRKKELDIDSAGFVDPITAVFKARMSNAEIGARLPFDVFTGESRYKVVLTVLGNDVIEVPAGRFEALKISPQVWKVRGADRPADKRLREATVWVTRDASRTLLRIRSKVFIGAVTLDLVKSEPPV